MLPSQTLTPIPGGSSACSPVCPRVDIRGFVFKKSWIDPREGETQRVERQNLPNWYVFSRRHKENGFWGLPWMIDLYQASEQHWDRWQTSNGAIGRCWWDLILRATTLWVSLKDHGDHACTEGRTCLPCTGHRGLFNDNMALLSYSNALKTEPHSTHSNNYLHSSAILTLSPFAEVLLLLGNLESLHLGFEVFPACVVAKNF